MLLLAGHSIVAASQESPNIKYGKINAADLAKKSYEIDTSANAVVLYEMGSSRIRGSVKGWFSLEILNNPKRKHDQSAMLVTNK